MILKPGDLFFGIMEFLAFIVPGFVLCATLPEIANFNVPDFLDVKSKNATAFAWFSFILISYISGHFLHHISAMALNPTYKISYLKLKLKKHRTFISKSEEAIGEELPLQTDRLKAAEAYLKINHPSIIPELEKHEANSKLFRSLCLLCPYICLLPCLNWIIVISLIAIAVLSFTKFANERWTHRFLVYQYFLITNVKKNST